MMNIRCSFYCFFTFRASLILVFELLLLLFVVVAEDFLQFDEVEIDATTGEQQRVLQKRIAGGRNSAKNPSYGISAGNDLCGAILIHPDILLSAAHCAGAFIPNGILMGVTKIDGSDNDEYIQVTKELLHPNYEAGSEENDIMLVQLKQSSLAPVKLFSTDPTVPAVGETLNVIGFGLTSSGGSSSLILQEADVIVTDHETCKAKYTEINQVVADNIMFCSGGEGIGACPGDSGGPLFHSGDIVVGIVSWGHDCGAVGFFDISTRVSLYTDWIRASICCISAVPPTDCPTDLTCPDSDAAITNAADDDSESPSSTPNDNGDSVEEPSSEPSSVPIADSSGTSDEPSSTPSSSPNIDSSGTGTNEPSSTPSSSPNADSSGTGTDEPSSVPSPSPGDSTNIDPSAVPSSAPNDGSTDEPSSVPSPVPNDGSTTEPSSLPSPTPDDGSTSEPSTAPSPAPDSGAADDPSSAPSPSPDGSATDEPSATPVTDGTSSPSETLSDEPSTVPTTEPTIAPTQVPIPTESPKPTALESEEPSAIPSADPTVAPTSDPTTAAPSPSAATPTPTTGPTLSPASDPTTVAPSPSADTPTPTETPVVTTAPTPAPTRAPTRPIIEIIFGNLPGGPPTFPPPPTDAPTESPSLTPSGNCSPEDACKFFLIFDGTRTHRNIGSTCFATCQFNFLVNIFLAIGWRCGPCP